MGNGGMVILQYHRWTFSHTQKICSRLYSIEFEFIFLNTNKKSLFELPFGGLRLTYYALQLKLVRKRKSVEVGVFRRGWVTLSANFRRLVALPTNHCWC